MDPAVRSARTQSAIITVSAEDRKSRRPERGITGLSSVVLRSKSSRSKNSRGERNFWMQRPEAENRLERPLMPTETERPERYRRISPSKRPNWSQRGILRFGIKSQAHFLDAHGRGRHLPPMRSLQIIALLNQPLPKSPADGVCRAKEKRLRSG
jgi:hypothetical protein